MTDSSDLFSSLVSLDNDDRYGLMVPFSTPTAKMLFFTPDLLADQDNFQASSITRVFGKLGDVGRH